MAEENDELQPAESRAWLKRMFGWWKWPGYSTAGLGFLRLFHLGEDVDFALNFLRSLGGDLGMIATVVASPFFGIAMVGYGVLHLLFVGESKQATRHHAWIYIGWAIFAICFVTIIGSVSYGLVQVYIEREVGKFGRLYT